VSDRGLVIFDCDGVLVDSEPIATRVLAEAIAEVGWPMAESEVQARFRGGTIADIVAAVETHIGTAVPDGWVQGFDRRRDAAFRAGLQPVPGAAEAVRGVRNLGFDVCVASQGRLAKSRLTLGLTGLDALFDPARVFSAYDVERPKPAPDLFLHAARTCGHDPARTVVVEDTRTGVLAARAATMRVLAYAADGDAAALAEAGGEPFGDMRELPALLS
jgi:HAD superfamily hydrolase (TIGR01509 family)